MSATSARTLFTAHLLAGAPAGAPRTIRISSTNPTAGPVQHDFTGVLSLTVYHIE